MKRTSSKSKKPVVAEKKQAVAAVISAKDAQEALNVARESLQFAMAQVELVAERMRCLEKDAIGDVEPPKRTRVLTRGQETDEDRELLRAFHFYKQDKSPLSGMDRVWMEYLEYRDAFGMDICDELLEAQKDSLFLRLYRDGHFGDKHEYPDSKLVLNVVGAEEEGDDVLE